MTKVFAVLDLNRYSSFLSETVVHLVSVLTIKQTNKNKYNPYSLKVQSD